MKPDELIENIRSLFELNNYEVSGPIKIHGAEVDLVANPKGGIFESPVYIEATIEYVDATKYGKDLSKLAMIQNKDPKASCVIISSSGFTTPVRERATETRIETLTFDELFNKFEKFQSYVNHVIGEQSSYSTELATLSSVYEEPNFDDSLGSEVATEFLSGWRNEQDEKKRWLIIVGEYGTGKTALTKVLQYRWMKEYKRNPRMPLPFRIELRDFTKQFDARGLIHFFLDQNGLGHIPIEFVLSLIRMGRIVLLLDGYDEMAQFLNSRERRTCLEALSELSSDGARGILTSRPNYFSEAEELQVLEVLYDSLESKKYFLGKVDRELIDREKEIDSLLEMQYLERFERSLKDLSVEQTKQLVERSLSNDPEGRKVVISLLNRIFRGMEEGSSISLSGKPVIISFLLEIVDYIKSEEQEEFYSEWTIYKLILDKLMLRDLRRSPDLNPEKRRNFLQVLSFSLSRRDTPFIDEESFRELIGKAFTVEIKRKSPESRSEYVDRLFSDLRSSSTLTRHQDGGKSGWRFSHASLREYLLCEGITKGLMEGSSPKENIRVSDAMKQFVASLEPEKLKTFSQKIADLWPSRSGITGLGSAFSLFFEAVAKQVNEIDTIRKSIEILTGGTLQLDNTEHYRIEFSSPTQPSNLGKVNFSESAILASSYEGANLEKADFSGSIIEDTNFSGCRLENAKFTGCVLENIILTDVAMRGADFSSIPPEDISIVVEDSNGNFVKKTEYDALGFIKFQRARTDKIPGIYVFQYHANYPIVIKIIEKLYSQGRRERRALEQRGASTRNVTFAKRVTEYLEQDGLMIQSPNQRNLVELTDKGREVAGRIMKQNEFDDGFSKFLEIHLLPIEPVDDD